MSNVEIYFPEELYDLLSQKTKAELNVYMVPTNVAISYGTTTFQIIVKKFAGNSNAFLDGAYWQSIFFKYNEQQIELQELRALKSSIKTIKKSIETL